MVCDAVVVVLSNGVSIIENCYHLSDLTLILLFFIVMLKISHNHAYPCLCRTLHPGKLVCDAVGVALSNGVSIVGNYFHWSDLSLILLFQNFSVGKAW